MLDVLVKKWPDQFTASDVAGMINNQYPNEDESTLRDYLLPGAPSHHVSSAKTITRSLLKRHLDEPVRVAERTLVLRRWQDAHSEVFNYHVVSELGFAPARKGLSKIRHPLEKIPSKTRHNYITARPSQHGNIVFLRWPLLRWRRSCPACRNCLPT